MLACICSVQSYQVQYGGSADVLQQQAEVVNVASACTVNVYGQLLSRIARLCFSTVPVWICGLYILGDCVLDWMNFILVCCVFCCMHTLYLMLLIVLSS